MLITGSENEGSVGLRLEHLKKVSALVNRNPIGTLYANENLWLGSKRIDSIVIRFRISNSWLADNRLDAKDIYLLRFDNGWTKLNSKVIDSDGNYTYFEAKTPGMSSFAVSGLKNNAQVPAALDEDITAAGQLEDTSGTGNTSGAAPSSEKKSPGFETATAGAVLMLIAYFYRKRRS